MAHLLGGIVLLRITSARTFYRYLARRAGGVRLWLRQKRPGKAPRKSQRKGTFSSSRSLLTQRKGKVSSQARRQFPKEIEERHGRKRRNGEERKRAIRDEH